VNSGGGLISRGRGDIIRDRGDAIRDGPAKAKGAYLTDRRRGATLAAREGAW
jgi:hypothetical protein